jgi:hypothetical protein
MQIIEHKAKKGLCVARACGNKKGGADRFCHKHRKRYQKENDLALYTYGAMKANARRRGKSFELTIDEFRDFCKRTNYLTLKGRRATSATIDRINPLRGYSADNIRLLSLSANASKGTKDDEEMPF